jgi:1,4-alpha-glucan branching enzyme
MGWMHDTLRYISLDPIHRKYHQNDLTFRMLYAYHENFVLPLSHDEVVHGKGPLWDKCAGDEWQKYASLRLLFGYQWGMTGKKLLFMGGEIAQRQEWRHDQSIDWHLLQWPPHEGVQRWVRDLNHFYRSEPAMYELDNQPGGFDWLDCSDAGASTLSFIRRGKTTDDFILCVLNFTPIVRDGYRIGVPSAGYWQEMLNSDSSLYWGSNVGNSGGVFAEPIPMHNQPFSISLNLPPLGAMFFKGRG